MPEHAQKPHETNRRSALRRVLMAQRHAMTRADVLVQTQHIHDGVLKAIHTQPLGSTIALYAAHAGEPDVLSMAQQLSALYPQTTLALPVVVEKTAGQTQPLKFAKWVAGQPLAADAHGIAVPVQKVWVTPHVMFIPCVGYCNNGGTIYRLGYGGGYYDRTLAALRSKGAKLQALGISWRHAQGVFEPNEFDVPMDAVLLG